MSAPRKIWVDYERDMFSFNEDAPTSRCPASVSAYHHDDVVQEMLEALERARAFIHGPGDRCGPVLRQIDAALAKIAQDA